MIIYVIIAKCIIAEISKKFNDVATIILFLLVLFFFILLLVNVVRLSFSFWLLSSSCPPPCIPF